MLVDPLPVKSIDLTAHTAITAYETTSFALVDLAPGKTVRKGSFTSAGVKSPAILTISHSVSKENGDVPTNRSLIRLDLTGLTAEAGVVGSLKAYAYIVIGAPVGAYDQTTSATLFSPYSLVQALMGVFAVSPTAATLDETNLKRVLAGEP